MDRKKNFNVGGQAVIEGVMMRAPEGYAIAVRKNNGQIAIHKQVLDSSKQRWRKRPLIRGVVILIESLVLGLKGISYSASQALEEEEEKLSDTTLALTMLAGIGLAVVLFAVLPVLIVRRLDFGIQHAWVSVLLEGIIRILIFLLYLIIISRYKDFQRIFQYHGAEHKTVYTFEAGRPLTVEEARGYSCLHPRCGTAFLLFVLVISIFIFSLLGKPGILLRITSRILLLPVIAGLSYEVIRWAGKNRDSKVVHWITLPGLWLQKLTTREPTDDQIEVAIAALNAAISVKEGSLTSVE